MHSPRIYQIISPQDAIEKYIIGIQYSDYGNLLRPRDVKIPSPTYRPATHAGDIGISISFPRTTSTACIFTLHILTYMQHLWTWQHRIFVDLLAYMRWFACVLHKYIRQRCDKIQTTEIVSGLAPGIKFYALDFTLHQTPSHQDNAKS